MHYLCQQQSNRFEKLICVLPAKMSLQCLALTDDGGANFEEKVLAKTDFSLELAIHLAIKMVWFIIRGITLALEELE